MQARWVAVALTMASFAATSPAAAFCGFYVSGADAKLFNNATQVVLMREGTRTVLSMQNNYQGPPGDFAMVVPVPIVLQEENVKTLPRNVFERIDALTAPRLVEYWEQDPCAEREEAKFDRARPAPAGMAARPAPVPSQALGVTVEAQFAVGEYQIVILSAKDASGLDTWLRQERYKIPEGAEPYLRPYVQSGSKFFVAKVDAKKVKFEDGMATLSPLRFHYDADTFSLPIRLGLMNSNGTQDLIVNILSRQQRYEVANYPNVTIPTNLEVTNDVRERFGPFYAALFDRTLESTPKAVVTEYAWDASTCDPCPTPALSMAELATLGADVLPSATAGNDLPVPTQPVRRPPSTSSATPTAQPVPPSRGRRFFPGSGFVLTRLHARYTKEAIGEDLVFRTAPPIMGGREMWKTPSTDKSRGQVEKGATAGSMNNFQGRYIIRHPWTGKIACENPRRGVWGGPPGGQRSDTASATNVAFAPRGQIKLAAMVREAVPEIGLQAPPSAADPAAGTSPTKSAGTTTGESGRNCSRCAIEPRTDRGSFWAAGLFAGLVFAARVRRGRRP